MRFLTCAVFAVMIGSQAASAADKLWGLEIFSQVDANDLEGEYNGLQVIAIPSTEGVTVLWRSANGGFDAPLLLHAQRIGNSLLLNVPDGNQLHGPWKLTLVGSVLVASGPRDLHFRLKKVS